jgi:arylsulfatase A-like enzyme
MAKPSFSRTWPWLVAAGVIVLIFLSTFIKIAPPSDWDPRPRGSADDIAKLKERKDVNVLFVVIDTLRADRLGSYGYERDTSPTLDRLAAGGVRFARHLAQSSWTKASMASLWTSFNPARTGILRFDQVVPPEAVLPAEILKLAGFQTIGLYRNGWVAPAFGFDQGFDVYERPITSPPPPSVRRRTPPSPTPPPTKPRSWRDGVPAAARQTTLVRVRAHDGRPEYLYDEKTALFGGRYTDIYDNSIRWTDTELGMLIDYLAQNGYLQNTMIVVTADAARGLQRARLRGPRAHALPRDDRDPAADLVPVPARPCGGRGQRTRNVDVWPTVLDLPGSRIGERRRSRVPEILASARGERPMATASTASRTSTRPGAARTTRRRSPSPSAKGSSATSAAIDGRRVDQLFDATDDPKEVRDQARKNPEALERLSKAADAYLELQPTWGKPPTKQLTELELRPAPRARLRGSLTQARVRR